MTKVKRCTCEHKFQDKMYGSHLRLHNQSKDGNTLMWTCTVCNKKKGDQ